MSQAVTFEKIAAATPTPVRRRNTRFIVRPFGRGQSPLSSAKTHRQTGKLSDFRALSACKRGVRPFFSGFVTSSLARIRFHPLFCQASYLGWK
jgi:hypothetical protein